MKLDLKNYRVLIIDSLAHSFTEPLCMRVLDRVFKIKMAGYSVTYGDKVLPFDKADFFGTHIIFCEVKGNDYFPVFAYKATPLDRCQKFLYDFPAFGLKINDLHPSVLGRVREIIEGEADPSNISYDSSWAQDLDYRFKDDRELKEQLREIMMMIIVKHHQDFKIPHMFACGMVKVKTDEFFFRIGLKMVNEHARFKEKFLNNAESVFFYSNSFSFEALQMATKYQDLWNKKLVISGTDVLDALKKKAS